jgi:NTE family protein
MIWKRKNIGLALGAGGARGLAHIGVLRVFEDESIPIDIIVGSSIGALVGGAFASGLGTNELEKRLEEFLESSTYQESALKSIRAVEDSERKLSLTQKIQAFFKNRLLLVQAMFKPGILESEDFHGMIDFFLPDIEIQDTLIPFRAVATDLVSGEPVVISQGSLRKAVMASCAVPGAVSPQSNDGMLLSDGGIIYMVPTTVARAEGAEYLVAVSVNRKVHSSEKFSTAIDTYVRSTTIGLFHIEQRLLREADVVILPRVGNLHWTDFGRATELILEGERAAREKLPDIRKVFHSPIRRVPSELFKRIFKRC